MKKRYAVILLLAHLLLVVFLGSQKINYHIDELYTFTLANRCDAELSPVFTDGQVYNGEEFFKEYLTVQPGHRFDYRLVYLNQRHDNHPFLYYFFIHTLCSFFPNYVSKWLGLIPNYLFLLAEDILLYHLAMKLFKRRDLALAVTVMAGTTLLTLDITDMIRMYVLMTVFAVAIALLLVSYYDREPDRKFWVRLFLLSMGGALTQYYFLIFLFFICLYFGIHLLANRQNRTALHFIRNMALAGAASIAVFPWIAVHIFLGSRGRQAFQNMGDPGSWKTRVTAFCRLIDNYVFGGLFLPVLLLALAAVVWYIAKNGFPRFLRRLDSPEGMLALSAAGYTLIISMIAPYAEIRYVAAVGWIFTFMAALLFKRLCAPLFRRAKPALAAAAVICPLLIFNLGAMMGVNWDLPMNFTATETQLRLAEEYGGNSVVYVYDADWKLPSNYLELIRYKDCTFVQPPALAQLLSQRKDDSLVLYAISALDQPSILETARSAGGFDSARRLYESYYADVYYLQK